MQKCDRGVVFWLLLQEFIRRLPTTMSIPSLSDLQMEYKALHPSVTFVTDPDLGTPYPADGDHIWSWMRLVEERGATLAIAAGIYKEAYATPRELPEHKLYHLWLTIPWYEVLVNRLTGRFGPTLAERDSAMCIKIRQLNDLKAERARLLAALAACDAEIAQLKS